MKRYYVVDAQYNVRSYQERDLEAVLSLLRNSLGESAALRRTPDLFLWKHIDNPFGHSIMLVAEQGKSVVGFRAFMRWDLLHPDGSRIRCVRAVDTATHPDHQRRGIFSTLTRAALDVATDDGVDLVFNTPNPRSGAGYLKMGWTKVGVIRPFASPARGLFRSADAADALTDPGDFVIDPIPVAARTVVDRMPLGLRTPRSDEYHAWRFQQHPAAQYIQIDGPAGTAMVRLAFRGTRRELLISDLYGDDLARTIRRVRRIARTSYVGAFFSKNTPERVAIVRSGFVPVPTATMTLMTRPLRPLEFDVKSLESWDISLSDLELL